MSAPHADTATQASPYAPPGAPASISTYTSAGRIAALDVLRGIVVVLMAIDHVRVYAGIPAGGTDPAVFFTRWITHFVAPVFVFLAGTAAYLYGRKVGSASALARFLVSRGLLLVLLELTVIRVSWTFNLEYGTYMLAGVIWVIGWSMVAMAAMVRLPTRAIAIVGVAIIALHNLLPGLLGPVQESLQSSGLGWLLTLLYVGGGVQFGADGPTLAVLYVFLPWFGVMAAGYAFGALYGLEAERRRRLLFRIGVAAVVAFVLLRFADVYGDGHQWRSADATGAWASTREFLNTSKYPASLLFLLMTLGPAILLLPVLETTRNRVTDIMQVFGRVPMFYYLLHIPLIHALACVVSLVRTGSVTPWLFANHPLWPPPPPAGYRWSLGLLYLMTVVAVTLLFFACRWYGRRKAAEPRPWMKYL